MKEEESKYSTLTLIPRGLIKCQFMSSLHAPILWSLKYRQPLFEKRNVLMGDDSLEPNTVVLLFLYFTSFCIKPAIGSRFPSYQPGPTQGFLLFKGVCSGSVFS